MEKVNKYEKKLAVTRATAGAVCFMLLGFGGTPSYAQDNVVTGQESGGRVGFQSEDGDFSLRIGGRLLMDTAWYDSDQTKLGSGTDIGAARLEASGKMYGDWSYVFQYDFTGTSEDGIKEAKVGYHGIDLGGNDLTLYVGNQFQPFGFYGQQSPKYTLFMEQPAVSLALGAGARRMGVRSDLTGSNWRLSLGVAQGILGRRATENRETDPVDLSAQFTVNLIQEKDHLLHLGASVRQHNSNDADGFGIPSRPQTSVANFGPINAGGGTSDGFFQSGIQGVYKNGPFSLESEYFHHKQDNVQTNTVNGADPVFSGAYVHAGWFLTGETRPFNPKADVFGPATPNSSLSQGGSGAWQIAAGYNTLDLADEGVEGGEMDAMIVGLNWYPEKRIRVALEYGKVLEVDGGANDGDEPAFAQARFQFEW